MFRLSVIISISFLFTSLEAAWPKEEGFYVVAKNYSPKVPDDLDSGLNPSDYLLVNKEAENVVQFELSDDYTYFFMAESIGHESGEIEYFNTGAQLSIPMNLSIKTSAGGDSAEAKASGKFLYQVVATYKSYDDLLLANPKVGVKDDDQVMVIRNEDGTFVESKETDDSSIFVSGGPFERGWQEEDKLASMKFTGEIYGAMGCFIATAVYGNWHAPELTPLREFRDEILMTSEPGIKLVQAYYRVGPSWALELMDRPYSRAILKPFISTISYAITWFDLKDPTNKWWMHHVVEFGAWFLLDDGEVFLTEVEAGETL